MLSEEEKARIRAEEEYRARIRGKQKPIRTHSFTDTMNRIRLIVALVLGVLVTAVGGGRSSR